MSASLAISITSSVSGLRRGSMAAGVSAALLSAPKLAGERRQRIRQRLAALGEDAPHHALEQGGIFQLEMGKAESASE